MEWKQEALRLLRIPGVGSASVHLAYLPASETDRILEMAEALEDIVSVLIF